MRAPSKPRPKLLALFTVAVATLLTSCISVENEIVLETDGSGVFSVMLLVDRQALELFALADDGVAFDPCSDFISEADQNIDLPEGVTTEPVIGDTACGLRVMAPFADTDELNTTTEQISNNFVGDDSPISMGDGGGFSITPTAAGGFEFNMTSFADTGIEGLDNNPFSSGLGEIVEAPSATIRVTFPSPIIDHNADSVDGTTAVWLLTLDKPQPDLFAVSSPDASTNGGVGWWLWVVVSILALVGIGLIGWALVRSRSSDSEPPAPPGGTGPFGPGTPGAARPDPNVPYPGTTSPPVPPASSPPPAVPPPAVPPGSPGPLPPVPSPGNSP